jgi:uncharacterized protein (TIGR00661 family)
MRILYGVLGHGRGHATRALGVLPHLLERHEILVVAGGDAHDTFVEAGLRVLSVPAMQYAYGPRGERCLWQSAAKNLRHALDLATGGGATRALVDAVRAFDPHAAICDADPWTHVVAQRLGVPRVSFDHFGVMVYCRPPVARGDRIKVMRDAAAYRMVVGRPERIIVSSFFHAPAAGPGIEVVGPLLRAEVRATAPSRGDFLLAYLNKGDHQIVPHIERALRSAGVPVVLYGTARAGSDGSIEYRPPGNASFLRDLAACRAVFSTAGNQLVGEALYFGKPMLVMPESTPEQRMNALALERLGAGRAVRLADVDDAVLRAFLADEDALRAAIPARVRDGRRDAERALDRALSHVAGLPRRRGARGSVAPAMGLAWG